MLIVRAKSDTEIAIEGDITGASDLREKFERFTFPPGATLHIDCRQIRYINSVGVKQWVTLFEGYRLEGTSLLFHGCSPMIVAQLSLMPNFARLGEIQSLQLPFVCPSCRLEQVAEFTLKELRSDPSGEPHIPSPPCQTCGTALTFDESPSEYFHFLG